jgi:hypothetical protein
MRMSLTSLVFCCALVVASAGAASAPTPGAVTLIKTIQKGTAFTTIDADHDGKASIGDYSIGTVVHVSPKTGKVMGGGTAICTQINATGTRFDCQGEDHFAGGQIREAGRFTFARTFRLAILGGTGIYEGASGELKGTWLDKQLTKARDVFTIRRG